MVPIYKFDIELCEGIIIDRPNRFLMNVLINSENVLCHCPPTGKIGTVVFSQNKCLVSLHSEESRKHRYTVEAIKTTNNEWIGINQSLINKYLNYFFETGSLSIITGNAPMIIQREVKIGDSKFDFLINNQVIEAKLFLNTIPGSSPVNNSVSKNSSKRFSRQYNDLINLEKEKYGANILYCYMYQEKILKSPILPHYSDELKELVSKGIKANIKHWQLVFAISPKCIELKLVHKISNEF